MQSLYSKKLYQKIRKLILVVNVLIILKDYMGAEEEIDNYAKKLDDFDPMILHNPQHQ